MHGEIIAPPTMLQAWIMRGLRGHHGAGARPAAGEAESELTQRQL